jgi:hypothetical protein
MDRRQFNDAVRFFTLARNFYESVGDTLVAEECAFAIALAQRVMGDAERRSKNKPEHARQLPQELASEYEPRSTAKDTSASAA